MLSIPAACWLCQRPLVFSRHGLCSVCQHQLLTPWNCCQRCGSASFRPQRACGKCLKKPPPWTQLVAVTPWQPPLSTLVSRLKFYRATALAVMLAQLLLLRWLNRRRETGLIRPDLLLAVPLHHRRIWQRGYNQLDDIARYLAHWSGSRYLPRAIRRIRAGKIQRHLDALARRRNLRGAYRLETAVHGYHIALIDDVVTTGSTVAEISRILMAAGAASVQIWCLCRTL